MRIIFFVIFMSLGCTSYAQVTFYVRPQFSTNTIHGYFPEAARQGFLSSIFAPRYRHKIKALSNQYFTFYNYGMAFSGDANVGINVGMQWNDRSSIELEYSMFSVGANHGVSIHRLSMNSETNTRQVNEKPLDMMLSGGVSGIDTDKIALTYNLLAWKNKKESLQLRTVMGLGIMTLPWTESSTQWYTGGFTDWPDPDGIEVHKINSTMYSVGTSFFVKLGLGIDWYTKKKHKPILSFDVSYLHSRTPIYEQTIQYRVTDNMVNTDYFYTLQSKGSGFYLVLSRRFNIYTTKSDKKQSKVEK